MGTIADKLNYLNTTKANIKNAIIEKGVTVETTDTFRDYATRISEITDGSVEELTVTENGTYTGEGVTYNPVNVNLPLGTKTLTANGTYTASDDSLQGYSEVTVDIDDTDLYRDTTDSTYESIKTLSNCGAFPMLSLKVGIEPQQDLHGYDSPWVGGAGKNLIPMTVDGIKALNTAHQWSGNAYTINGVTFTIETDSDENVIGINVNGTATVWTTLNLGEITLPIGTYTLSNASALPPSGVYLTHNPIGFVGNNQRIKTATITTEQSALVYIGLDSGISLSNYTLKPMIETGSTATSYEPYSNICPISGWDEANIVVSPTTDAEDGTTYTIDLDGTRYGGTLDVVSGVLTVDREKLMLADNASWIKYGSYDYGVRVITDKFDSISNDLLMAKSMSNMLIIQTTWGEDNRIVFGQGNSKTTLLLTTESTGLDANSSVDDVKAWLRTAGVYMIAPLATPLTIQLTPTAVKSLLGTNNLWADTGDVGDVRYFKKVEL